MNQALRIKSGVASRVNLRSRLQVVDMLEMSERDFAKFIRDLETDPLFQKLFRSRSDAPRVLRRDPWPSTRLHGSFYELNEETAPSTVAPDVESLLEKRSHLIAVIRRIGQEAFEKFFLYSDEGRAIDEIARLTGLSEDEVRGVNDLLLELSVQSEFLRPGAPPRPEIASYALIAHIELEGERISFAVLSPHLARGRYLVNQEALEQWKTRSLLGADEARRVKALLQRVECANIRQRTLWNILETAARHQAAYLRTRDGIDVRPLSMRMLAKQLGVAPSTVSRAASHRSVRLPWGEEVPLAALLVGRPDVVRRLVEDLLAKPENAAASDSMLARIIQERRGIGVSRRTVNDWRRRLR